MVDVKNKRCEEEECMKRGLFGYDGERARFCGTHRLQGNTISHEMHSSVTLLRQRFLGGLLVGSAAQHANQSTWHGVGP